MKTVVPTTLDIAREAGWSGENEPKDFVGALKLLSDHIGPASPEAVTEAVDDWLDNHPEALVANGSVTTEKLADGAVTEEKLGVDLGNAPERVAELQGNQLMGELSGTIDTAADAYAAPPMSLVVEGASTQDGTPTPDAPQPILSVDDLGLVLAGKNLFDKDHATNINGYFDSEGKINDSNSDRIFVLPVKPNTSYTISFTRVILSGNDDVGFWMFDVAPAVGGNGISKSATWTSAAVTGGTAYTVRFTATSSTHYIAVKYANINKTDASATLATVQIEIGSTATAYEPYVGTTVPDLLPEGTELRSLPDGTRDQLNLAYLRPSTRAGWAWYSRKLMQRTYQVTFDGSENWVRFGKQNSSGYYFAISQDSTNPLCSPGLAIMTIGQLWSHYPHDNPYDVAVTDGAVLWRASDWTYNNVRVSMPDGVETVADFKTWLASNNVTVQYILATPVTTQLDPIELPQLPSENATVWCDGGSAQPSYTMEYVKDTNIVIANMQAMLDDLATS